MSEHSPFIVPLTEVLAAREVARRGDCDAAIPVLRTAVDDLISASRLGFGVLGTDILVEALLRRGGGSDLAEAQEAIDRLATLPADGSAMREITLLRLHALSAGARADAAVRDLAGQYLAMARSLGFEGHVAWAEAMIEN
jgi:hypothetical protein